MPLYRSQPPCHMRIGFDAKRIFHNRTGLGNYGRDIIRILRDHQPGFELYLYNTKHPDTSRIVSYADLMVRYPVSWFWKRFRTFWRLIGMGRQLRKDRLYIYHGLSGEIPLGIRNLPLKKIVTIHDLIFLSHPHYYKWFDRMIYTFKHRHAATHADKIIAISEQTKRDLIHYFKIDAAKIEVIYQGCNERFKQELPKAQIDAVRKKYDLPEEYILNVGTIQERKNVLSLIKALQSTPYKLVIVGSPKSYFRKVKEYIESNDLDKQITVLPHIEVQDLVAIYQGARLFCYPSICEGFGIPIIEAMYSGLPVITSTGSCFPEAGGPSTTYVEPGDIPTLREAIIRLMEDEAHRNKAITEGLAYVQRFNDEEVARNLQRVYEELLA